MFLATKETRIRREVDSEFWDLLEALGLSTDEDNHYLAPERRLLMAVIDRGIRDAVGRGCFSDDKYTRKRERLRAWQWFFNTNDTGLISFKYCCDHLCEDGEGLASTIRRFIMSVDSGNKEYNLDSFTPLDKRGRGEVKGRTKDR